MMENDPCGAVLESTELWAKAVGPTCCISLPFPLMLSRRLESTLLPLLLVALLGLDEVGTEEHQLVDFSNHPMRSNQRNTCKLIRMMWRNSFSLQFWPSARQRIFQNNWTRPDDILQVSQEQLLQQVSVDTEATESLGPLGSSLLQVGSFCRFW